jgi:hypothetical protein
MARFFPFVANELKFVVLPVFGKILAGPEKFSSGKEENPFENCKKPSPSTEMKVFQWPSQYFSRASIFPKTGLCTLQYQAALLILIFSSQTDSIFLSPSEVECPMR